MPDAPSDPTSTLSLTVDAVRDLADVLDAHARQIQSAAGGAPRDGADVPYDWFDLKQKLVTLDEVREAFDLRVAGFLQAEARAAAAQADRTATADGLR